MAVTTSTASIALLTLTLAILFALDLVQIWHIYVLMFLRSLGGSFHGPAMAASTSLMVPKRHLARIQGVNQMLGGGLNIIAAPLGALLLELLPMQGDAGVGDHHDAAAVAAVYEGARQGAEENAGQQGHQGGGGQHHRRAGFAGQVPHQRKLHQLAAKNGKGLAGPDGEETALPVLLLDRICLLSHLSPDYLSTQTAM